MLMGLINASVIWQRFITYLLQNLLNQGVVVYLDDIFIYTKKDPGKHQQLAEEVLKRLIKNELYIDIKKTEFSADEVEFLKYIIRVNGIRMDSEKI